MLNPILREKGIASLLGVPLLAGGTVLGVLHVGTLTPRRFTEQDAQLLQMVADRAATATQSRMSQAERAAAAVLQRTLLPARPPDIPGLEFASRYVPGHRGQVGGDWYDVFALPSGAVCLVVGDVVGHGLAAAQSMSQIRAVLRVDRTAHRGPRRTADQARRTRAVLPARHHGHRAVRNPQPRGRHAAHCPRPDTYPPSSPPPDDAATIVTIPADLPLGVEARAPPTQHPRAATAAASCSASTPTGSSSGAASSSTTTSKSCAQR